MFKILSLTLLLISVNAFTAEVAPVMRSHNTFNFNDDLNFKHLNKAIDRQILAFKQLNYGNETIQLGDEVYRKKVLLKSLIVFKTFVNKAIKCQKKKSKKNCQKTFSNKINEYFNFYKPVPGAKEPGAGKDTETLFTSYYSPDFEGSTVKDETYKHAVYKNPKHLIRSTRRGRRNRRVYESATRVQIDFDQKLAGKGLEAVYVKEPLFDLYLLHVEGGGRVRIKQDNGKYVNKYLSYDGGNGRSFQMIYKYMIEQGMLIKGEASIKQQRAYLADHPEVRREVFNTCPSYIFFKLTEEEPIGINEIPLTENRSMAIDIRKYPFRGMLHFVEAKRPIEENGKPVYKNFSRFFLSQDTGGAIRGNARVDLYFGYGKTGEYTANHLKTLGTQTILIYNGKTL